MLIIALIPIVVCIWVALKNKYSFLASVQLSCLGCALFLLIMLGSVYLATGKDIVSATLDQWKLFLQQNEEFTKLYYSIIQSANGAAVSSQISLNDAVNTVYPYFVQTFTYGIPAFCAASIPLGGLILYLAARAIAKKAGAKVIPIPAFADFKLPPKFGRWTLIILIICWIGQMAGWRNFNLVFTIAFAFFGSIYYVLGLAFTEWFLKKQIKSGVGRFFIIAIIVFVFWQFYIFTYFGIFEQIVKVRQRSSIDKGTL